MLSAINGYDTNHVGGFNSLNIHSHSRQACWLKKGKVERKDGGVSSSQGSLRDSAACFGLEHYQGALDTAVPLSRHRFRLVGRENHDGHGPRILPIETAPQYTPVQDKSFPSTHLKKIKKYFILS